MRMLGFFLIVVGGLAVLYGVLRGQGDAAIAFSSALAGGEVKVSASVLRGIGMGVAVLGMLLMMVAARRGASPAPDAAPAAVNPADAVAGIKLWAAKSKVQLPPDDRLAAIVERLQKGEKIEAIKIWREATNAGLKQSKESVEGIERALRVLARIEFGRPQ